MTHNRSYSRRTVSGLVVVVTLMCTMPVGAQQPAGPPQLPRWEVGAGFGGFSLQSATIDTVLPAENPSRFTVDDWVAFSFGADIGYYWTTHVKVEASYTERTALETIDSETVVLAITPRAIAYPMTYQSLRMPTVSAAVVYQFRDNVFLHPYVSGGARLGWLRQHRYRDRQDPERPYPLTVQALDEHNEGTLLRPFVAAGVKGYLGRYAFLKPEAAFAFGAGVAPDVSFRVVIGRDF